MARAAFRPDRIRRHNLALLLEEIHRHGELSRADLTQRLGLNRSTIGALVSDLAELGLVSEFVPSRGERAGRPSHLVGPREDGPYVIAVDLEVDRVVSAGVGICAEMLCRREDSLAPDQRHADAVVAVAARQIESLIAATPPRARPVGVGISVPGTISRDGSTVSLSPNLDWHNLALPGMVAREFTDPALAQLPITLGNDADLGVMAEHLRGSARGSDDVVFLTGRMGVGAGILSGGLPLRGHQGRAGEIGHVVLDPSGPACHCGNHGCVETYIGQAAVLAKLGRSLDKTSNGVAWLRGLLDAGDLDARDAIASVANPLGRTLANLVNLLNPERVVLGGILAAVLQVAEAEVQAALDQHAFDAPHGTLQLREPGLGSDSSLMGAAELAFAQLLSDPVHWSEAATAS